MATKLEKLFFAIGVQDGASNKVAKLQANIAGMAKKAQGHFRGIGTAALGLVGVGLSIKAIAGPAVELNKALGEVGALGVDAEGLKVLQNEAGRFAMQYGQSAKDVIRSSVAIQEQIDGLTARELATFTSASNVLALAGRSSVESMTGYMGTMYGIFEAQANRMGKSRWAEQMAGQTEFIARAFKVKGEDIAAGFTALGDRATRAGIEAGEQMAVIAALQKTMGGASAGDRFKSFVSGAGKAGSSLGISFTDQKGEMRSMMDILDQVRGKYGDTLTEAQQIKFSKAFNDKEAGSFINTLLSKQGQLSKAIRDVKTVSDMTGARASARQTTDAFQRFGASVEYVRGNFMQKLLPTLERWTNKASDHLDTLNKWITKYPNVTRVIGYCVLGVLALAAVVALVSMGFHLWKLASTPLTKELKLLFGAIRANPLFFLIFALLLCIEYWDEVSAAIGFVWDMLREFFANIGPIGAPFLAVMDAIEERWRMVTDLFADFTWTKLLKTVIAAALLPLELFINGIGELLDLIPGMGEEAKALMNWKAGDFADSLLGPEQARAGAPGLQKAQVAEQVVGPEPAKTLPAGIQKVHGTAAMPSAPGLQKAQVAEQVVGPEPAQTVPEGLQKVHGTALMPSAPAVAAQVELARRRNPELAGLAQARTLQIKQGGVMGANSSRVNNTGKTITIGEQHIHVENMPMSADDLAALNYG